MLKHPAVPFVLPMAVFAVFLSVGGSLGLGEWEFPFRVAVLGAVLWVFSRDVIDLRMPNWASSTLLGIAVFLVWVAPDALFGPGYRSHWLFENALTGKAESSFAPEFHGSIVALVFRTIRATLVVPIVEELFWRGWLMRYLINSDFVKVPLGAYAHGAFWITAALFATEHGAYWEVGLLAGAAFNWWMVRTRSLGDCILAHGVANLLLSGYVMQFGEWRYW